MSWNPTIKAARMTVGRDAVNGGKVQIVRSDGTLLWEATLDNPSGVVDIVGSDAVLTLAGFPKSAAALAAASYAQPPLSARLRTSLGADAKTGLTVGLKLSAAPLWAGNTAVAVGALRTNGANQYRATAATGNTAPTGGPTGTGAAIVDGGVTWAYVCPANAAVQLDAFEWSAGAVITVAAGPTLTHAT